MTRKRSEITSAHYFQSARKTDELADEFRAKAIDMEKQEVGHECGHTWTIGVRSVGHYSVSGKEHFDANEVTDDDPSHGYQDVTVRAHSLSEALRKAAALPLTAWYGDLGEES